MSNCSQDLSSIDVNLELTREEINELGSKAPYKKYVNFPVETDAEITVCRYKEKEKQCRILTIIGWLNVLICQWLFFRIGHFTDVDDNNRYNVIFPILPLSGWGSGFIPKRYLVITRNYYANDESKHSATT